MTFHDTPAKVAAAGRGRVPDTRGFGSPVPGSPPSRLIELEMAPPNGAISAGRQNPDPLPMPDRLPAVPNTVHWGFFDARLKPVLTVESGAEVEIETVSGAPDALPGPGFEVPEGLRRIHAETPRPLGSGHILTGPVAVAGAVAGDVLQVEILEARLGTDWGWNAIRPLGGALPDQFPEGRMVTIPLDRDTGEARMPWGGGALACRPFFGVMGTAPPEHWGMVSSVQPRAFGGNIDCKELTRGSVLYLPVFTEGALFSCGDGHAVQGDGEVCLTAVETALTGRFRLTLRKGHGAGSADGRDGGPVAPVRLRRLARPGRPHGTQPDDRLHLPALQPVAGGRLHAVQPGLRPAHITQLVNQQQGVHAMLDKQLIP